MQKNPNLLLLADRITKWFSFASFHLHSKFSENLELIKSWNI
jgi:hypothetical protein